MNLIINMHPSKAGPFISGLTVLTIALVIGCGSSATTTPIITPATVPVDSTAIKPILATTVLEVGKQRLAFLLSDSEGIIKTPNSLVTAFYMDGDGTQSTSRVAEFNLWPYGIRGSYSTYFTFDRAGQWRLEVQVNGTDSYDRVQFDVEVLKKSLVPGIGNSAPQSLSKILSDYSSLHEITTDYSPDPDLYQLTIKDAIENHLPSVVVFASPAFCTSPTCGPQVDAVSELKELHPDQANYIHVEIYDDPAAIQGNLDRAEIFSVVEDWGLTSIDGYFNESWTFILDSNGQIDDRFEGFATVIELDRALRKVMTSGPTD